ncbi:hypothetical protein, partial [Frateuria sp.]|uniref:hypothetical protein n=1 Tax=Frateuria sp. TaxID=2211372 RepID=UPI003F7DC623
VFAWLVRHDRGAFPFALVASLLYAASLATWFAVVSPANAVLATWQPGPLPGDFAAIRDRWEIGHMIVATVKFCGLTCIFVAALRLDRCRT